VRGPTTVAAASIASAGIFGLGRAAVGYRTFATASGEKIGLLVWLCGLCRPPIFTRKTKRDVMVV
jgi:hypothetical protein